MTINPEVLVTGLLCCLYSDCTHCPYEKTCSGGAHHSEAMEEAIKYIRKKQREEMEEPFYPKVLVTGLRCCLRGDCAHCPYEETCYGDIHFSEAMSEAVDYIREKQREEMEKPF